jgi:hypothetical protein
VYIPKLFVVDVGFQLSKKDILQDSKSSRKFGCKSQQDDVQGLIVGEIWLVGRLFTLSFFANNN